MIVLPHYHLGFSYWCCCCCWDNDEWWWIQMKIMNAWMNLESRIKNPVSNESKRTAIEWGTGERVSQVERFLFFLSWTRNLEKNESFSKNKIGLLPTHDISHLYYLKRERESNFSSKDSSSHTYSRFCSLFLLNISNTNNSIILYSSSGFVWAYDVRA